MKVKWIVLGMLLAGSVLADVIYNDYSSAPIKVDTGLSSSTTATAKYLYINTLGDVSTSNPSGLDVHFTAYRDRDTTLGFTSDIEEYVSATSGICLTSLSAGTEINSSLNFGGGNILYQQVNNNPGDHTWTASTRYLGFRISDGAGDYYYGWAQVYAQIQTVQGAPSSNRAMVQINQVAISDVAGEFIEAGQTVPEPASVLMIGAGAAMLGIFRRFYSHCC